MIANNLDPQRVEHANAVVDRCMGSMVPPAKMPAAQWFRERFRDEHGNPFVETRVPWVTAPGGPCDALDNPEINEIWLQWAARMFKTQFCQGMQMYYADQDPCSMMFATTDRRACHNIFRRFWNMLDASPGTHSQVPAEHRRGKEEVSLTRSMIYGAWSRSVPTLADKSIRVGHGNEIDKWEQYQTAGEGDPLPRFLKRGDQYCDRKFGLESTPAVRGKSRIEAGRLKSANARLVVPCPHCGKFDEIRFGDGKEPPGIFWETKDGRHDPDHARQTAYYVCGFCKNQIDDIHRPEMMNLCVWVPEGCQVDHDRAIQARDLPQFDRSYLIGEPARKNNSWGSQLPVWYALFKGWGGFASDFLEKKKKKITLRQWTNEDKAETWEIVANKQDWEDLADIMIVSDQRLGSEVVPEWTKLITIGIDCQPQQGSYPYSVDAWGVGERTHTLRYGTPETLDDLFRSVVDRPYFTPSGKEFRICMGLIDTGFKPHIGHAFSIECRQKGYQIFACKGSNTALNADYMIRQLQEKSSHPGEILVHVDTTRSQYWLEGLLDSPREMSSVFYDTIGFHEEYFQQLLNDAAIEDTDTTNNVTEKWQRIDENLGNDYRDCKRYSWAARQFMTESRPIPEDFEPPQYRVPQPEPEQRTRERQRSGFIRGGGGVRKFRRGFGRA